jgi:hypothetical protein
MAEIGWIDFSANDRDKVSQVIQLLGEEGSVDELGVGTVRNSLSDWLFPGMSTIQTRAKYFLIVPRIIKDYQLLIQHKRYKGSFREYFYKSENEIIQQLAQKYQGGKENGVFGITLAGQLDKELARKPSSIYWNGLRVHQIINTELSLAEYFSRFDQSTHNGFELTESTNDEQGDDQDADYNDPFGILLPDSNQAWRENLDIPLSREEASFLKHHFIDCSNNPNKDPDNLLGIILSKQNFTQDFLAANDFNQMAEAFLEIALPKMTKRVLSMASMFDLLIHGAHIRYNIQLQQQMGTEEKAKEFMQDWNEWIGKISKKRKKLKGFEIDYLFSDIAINTKPFTKRFIHNWFEAIKDNSDNTVLLDEMVADQEYMNKKKKARIKGNKKETYNGWIGLNGLEYRYKDVKGIVADIVKGEKNRHA